MKYIWRIQSATHYFPLIEATNVDQAIELAINKISLTSLEKREDALNGIYSIERLGSLT